MKELDQEQPVDGRHARSQRARAAIINALIEVLEEGRINPSAQQIAERAGVSLRLVFHHFRDMESLYTEMFGVVFKTRILPHLRFPSGEGPFAERLTTFVEQRSRLFEAIGPIRRAGEWQEPLSPTLTQQFTEGRTANAAEAITTFTAELEALPEDVRPTVTNAVVMATSFASWDMMRRHQKLSVDEAKKVLDEALRRLLRQP
jgi:TetR/AcrR family transcriptional regulator of autoinduction and epiphytic fitness